MSVHLLNPKPETETDTLYIISLVDQDGKVTNRWTKTDEPLYNPQTDWLSFTDEDNKRVVIFNPGRSIVREQ